MPLAKLLKLALSELSSSGLFTDSSSSKHRDSPSQEWGKWTDEPVGWLVKQGTRGWIIKLERSCLMVGFQPAGWVQADLQGSLVGPDCLISFISDLEEETLLPCELLWTPNCRCSWPAWGQGCHAEGPSQLREWTSRNFRKFSKNRCLAHGVD